MMQCMIAGIGVASYNATSGRAMNDAPHRGESQMAKWIRFEQGGKTGFGTLEGDTIAVHEGDMFAGAKPSGADAETLRRRGPHAMRSVEDDLPVE